MSVSGFVKSMWITKKNKVSMVPENIALQCLQQILTSLLKALLIGPVNGAVLKRMKISEKVLESWIKSLDDIES